MRRSSISPILVLLFGGGALAGGDFQATARIAATPVLGSAGPESSRTGLLVAGEFAMERSGHVWFVGADVRTLNSAAREVTQFGKGYYRTSGGQILEGLVTPFGTGPDGLPNPNAKYDSVDIRRNKLAGFSLSVGYRRRLGPSSPFSLHGGFKLASFKSSQEVSASLKVVTNRATPAANDPVGTENIYDTFSKTSIKPGAFLGLRVDMGNVLFAEFNATALTYSSVHYVPFTYTGQSSRLETQSRTKALLECSVGFRF